VGVRYEWADERQIIMNIYMEAPWTWQQYNDMVDAIMPLIHDLQRPAATVVDVTKMGTVPEPGSILPNLLRMEKAMPENVFATVVVGTPLAAKIFVEMLMRLRPRMDRITLFADTMTEAHEKILAHYAQLSTGET
jgi:hypothetical protein